MNNLLKQYLSSILSYERVHVHTVYLTKCHLIFYLRLQVKYLSNISSLISELKIICCCCYFFFVYICVFSSAEFWMDNKARPLRYVHLSATFVCPNFANQLPTTLDIFPPCKLQHQHVTFLHIPYIYPQPRNTHSQSRSNAACRQALSIYPLCTHALRTRTIRAPIELCTLYITFSLTTTPFAKH